MVLAAHLGAAFFAAGIAAWYLLKGRHIAFARRSLELSATFAAALIGMQILAGLLLADVMAQAQPGKFTAIEGRWETEARAAYVLAIIPDEANERNTLQIGIPVLGSQLIAHNPDAVIPGVKAVPKENRPSLGTVFWSFRTMFYLAILMFGFAVAGLWLRLKGRLVTTRWYLKGMVAMTPAGLIATIAGWYVAEIGRQPWVVNGMLRTAQAVSPVPTATVWSSLAAFAAVDTLFLSAFVALTIRTIARGPAVIEAPVAGPLKRVLAPPAPGTLDATLDATVDPKLAPAE
jgi:cytochrome d ubiquinol oxidase subunit I